VKDGRFETRLREARGQRELSLEAAAREADISAAYMHKLEAGRVNSPSPHVLRRLAGALGVGYSELMELAGYLEPATERREKPMAPGKAPTNSEIVRLLEELRAELAELARAQQELLRRVEAR
jgi:transcriptional regulator with XRE-family HTH domain